MPVDGSRLKEKPWVKAQWWYCTPFSCKCKQMWAFLKPPRSFSLLQTNIPCWSALLFGVVVHLLLPQPLADLTLHGHAVQTCLCLFVCLFVCPYVCLSIYPPSSLSPGHWWCLPQLNSSTHHCSSGDDSHDWLWFPALQFSSWGLWSSRDAGREGDWRSMEWAGEGWCVLIHTSIPLSLRDKTPASEKCRMVAKGDYRCSHHTYIHT